MLFMQQLIFWTHAECATNFFLGGGPEIAKYGLLGHNSKNLLSPQNQSTWDTGTYNRGSTNTTS